jgi:esterase/lipase superfamily enzyme
MLIQIKNYYIIPLIVVTAVALFLFVFTPNAYATLSSDSLSTNATKKHQQQQQPLLSILSTRDVPIFTPGHLTKLVSDTITKFEKTCPSDMVIYIHGFNKSKDDAGEEFNRIQSALNFNNSTIPFIGFSWDSKVPWEQAKVNAKNTGEELVKFILAFKSVCKDTAFHLVAHSLGAAVVETTLTNLDTYLNTNTIKNSKL